MHQDEDEVTIQGTYLDIYGHRNPIYVDSHTQNVPYIWTVAIGHKTLKLQDLLVCLTRRSNDKTQVNQDMSLPG